MPKFLNSTDIVALLGDDFADDLANLARLGEAGSIAAAISQAPTADVPEQAGHGGSGGSSVVSSGSTVAIPGGYEWHGISFSSVEGYFYPPDNGFAANAGANGTTYAIAAENGAIESSSLSGGSYTETTASWTTLFKAQSGYSLTDPRILYDGSSGHFIITVDEYNAKAGSSFLLYAVSNSSTPSVTSTSNWSLHSVSTTEGGTWADQPLVAENDGILYTTTNQFMPNGQYSSDFLTAVSVSSGASLVTPVSLDSFSFQPVTISDGASSTEFFVSHSQGSLHIFGATDNGSGGVTIGPEYTVSGLLPDYGLGSYSASQLGTSYKLDAGDGRVTSAAYDAAHQQLYAVFEFQPSNSSSVPAVELVQVDTASMTVIAAINLNSLLPTSGATSNAATFNASVAVDNQGDVLANFNVSGPNMYAADYYALWKAPAGGFTAVNPLPSGSATLVDYQNSAAAYVDPGHDQVGRWGDYSTAVADANPNATNGFWISNEYDNGTVTILGQHLSSWGTSMAHVAA